MAISGSDVSGLSPQAMAAAWRKRKNPAMPAGGLIDTRINPPGSPQRMLPQRMPFQLTGGASSSNPTITNNNPYSTALANIRAGGSGVTSQIRNPAQNAFSQVIRDTLTSNQPARKGALTSFVKDAYGRTAGVAKALDQENKAIDKVFSDDGLIDELANARAKRRASVMMGTKMAMDRAKRQNNVNRMMAGNSSYLDRAYGDALARIAVDAGTQDADLEREDLRYMQGQRMGALGSRDQLLRNFLSTSLIPMNAQRQALMEDIGAEDALGRLEDRNTIYETPEQRMRREIALADGTAYLNDQAEGFDVPLSSPAASYNPPRFTPQPYPLYGSGVPTTRYGGPLQTGRARRMLPRFNNLRYAV